MNYIWYPLIKAIEKDYDTTKIHYNLRDEEALFSVGEDEHSHGAFDYRISPLFEYLPAILSDPSNAVKFDDKFSVVDINPYHRFAKIFNHIILPDRNDTNDLIICDILTHILAHIDRICGMSKRDFLIVMIMDGLEKSCYGIANNYYGLFTVPEKRSLAEALIMMYETTDCLRSLDVLISMIMPDFRVRIRDDEEVVLYNHFGYNEKEDKKLKFIIKLFMPITIPYVIHWQHTYGTIGQDRGMELEEFVV